MALAGTKKKPEVGVGVARDEEAKESLFQEFLGRIGQFWTLGVLVALIILFGTIAPDMYTEAAWNSTSSYAVEYLILAVGETFVILTGGIDLAVGATMGFSGMAGALVMSNLLANGANQTEATILGIAMMLVAGMAIGFANGLIITKLKIPPFIVTLGTMTAIMGGTDLLNNGGEVTNLTNFMGSLGSDTFLSGWLNYPVVIALVAAVLASLTLSRTKFGMRTYSIGSNEIAARRSGIHVDRHLIRVYVISGLMSGIAAILITANLSSANATTGTANDNLYAIASVIIGGASLFGGRGTILGTFIGTSIIAVLETGLVLANVAPFWQEVAIGAIIVCAVAIDRIRVKAGTD
ncbi:MAG TPA: ABC transporter permease [Acidimicrobiales bacterium]